MNERQRRFIEQAARERGLFWADVEELCFRTFGLSTRGIDHAQARSLCQIVIHLPKPAQVPA
jgi:hypothetical protein